MSETHAPSAAQLGIRDIPGPTVAVDSIVSKGVTLTDSGHFGPRLYVPRVFTSTIATGPPQASFGLQDGDIWSATAVDANGTRWQFQYNANSSSSFKWEFVGGFPITASPANFNNGVVTGFQVQTGVGNTITLPRAGDYELRMTGYNNDVTTLNNNQVSIGYAINGAQTGKWAQMGLVSGSYTGWFPYHVEDLLLSRAAGDVVAPTVNPDSRDQTLVNTYLSIIPRRVS